MKKRISFIDIAKLIAITGVIFDHSQYYVGVSQSFMVLRIWIFTFFLSTFFFVPGIVSKERPLTRAKDWWRFISDTFRSIMVPYYIWGFILSGTPGLGLARSLIIGTQSSLQLYTDSILWFMPVLFTSKVFYQCAIQLTNGLLRRFAILGKTILSFLFLAAGVTLGKVFQNSIPLGADIGLVGCSLMLMGSVLKGVLMWLHNEDALIKSIVLVILLAASVMTGYLNTPYTITEDGQVVYTASVWMARGMYGRNGILFMLSSTLALSMLLERLRFLSLFGQHTMGIMCIHNKLLYYSAAVCSTIPLLNGRTDIVCQLLLTLITLLLCVPGCFLIAHFAPWLEGRKSK